MKFLRMNKRAAVHVTLPTMNGGVNLYDIPTEAADNQLTACDNVWWHKGALRTRPGIQSVNTGGMVPQGARQMVNEREMLTTMIANKFLYAYYVDVNGIVQKMGMGGSPEVGNNNQTVLGFRAPANAEKDWYFLLSGGAVLQGDQSTIEHAAPYIPTVIMNGYGDEGNTDHSTLAGDAYEDYNMLTRAYKAKYTTDGISTKFRLPEVDQSDNSVTDYGHIKITMADGKTVESDIVRAADRLSQYAYMVFNDITGAQIGSENYKNVQMTGRLDTVTGIITITIDAEITDQSGTGTELERNIPIPRVCDNNIEITAYRSQRHDEKRETICKMTRCTWYGGSRSGLAGGTRLFVCGNPDEPNLLHWSGIEHPLYFPEHNYNRIGDADEAITAFGKQGELLILFKEHHIYAAQYAEADEADYTFATESGVPITTYTAQFPVTPLQDSVGCDCPDSVRLVNNRLVWANSNGHVYLLTATNQFSERNVRDISRNVTEDMTQQGAALKNAVAGEYEGYYMLAVGRRVYLLDTQNSAFASFNYYSSEDSARKALPWYIWTLPQSAEVYGMVSDGSRVIMAPSADNSHLYTFGGDTDDGELITAHFATKRFNFGMPDRTKSVGQIYIGVQASPQGRATLTYITEKGSRRDPYEIDGAELAALGNGEGLRTLRLTPYMNLVQTFGIRVDATAPVAVDGMMIKVQQQGVVR